MLPWLHSRFCQYPYTSPHKQMSYESHLRCFLQWACGIICSCLFVLLT
uniref:Uncharacterized protein n=1 Tax=Arundo donax TaxID=35708 RepID=A0A0A9G0F8_ARUDO